MLKHKFDRLLMEAIDEGLSTVGESPRRAIYCHLEKSFNIKKEEIPANVEIFESAMEKMFGCGADFLEVLIMKRLYEKTSGEFEFADPSDFDFSKYVNLVKKRLLEKKESKLAVHVAH